MDRAGRKSQEPSDGVVRCEENRQWVRRGLCDWEDSEGFLVEVLRNLWALYSWFLGVVGWLFGDFSNLVRGGFFLQTLNRLAWSILL